MSLICFRAFFCFDKNEHEVTRNRMNKTFQLRLVSWIVCLPEESLKQDTDCQAS
ncbi:MAG: hypothetical protein QOI77_2220 [Blastocatellia bacterium]|nr:hypothetical protein [Blastocatellia bacterium]